MKHCLCKMNRFSLCGGTLPTLTAEVHHPMGATCQNFPSQLADAHHKWQSQGFWSGHPTHYKARRCGASLVSFTTDSWRSDIWHDQPGINVNCFQVIILDFFSKKKTFCHLFLSTVSSLLHCELVTFESQDSNRTFGTTSPSWCCRLGVRLAAATIIGSAWIIYIYICHNVSQSWIQSSIFLFKGATWGLSLCIVHVLPPCHKCAQPIMPSGSEAENVHFDCSEPHVVKSWNAHGGAADLGDLFPLYAPQCFAGNLRWPLEFLWTTLLDNPCHSKIEWKDKRSKKTQSSSYWAGRCLHPVLGGTGRWPTWKHVHSCFQEICRTTTVRIWEWTACSFNPWPPSHGFCLEGSSAPCGLNPIWIQKHKPKISWVSVPIFPIIELGTWPCDKSKGDEAEWCYEMC